MNSNFQSDYPAVNHTVDLLKAVLAISSQEGIEAIAYEACKQVVEMLGVFTVSFAVINREEKTGRLMTEYISEDRETDPQWFQPLYYPDLPIITHVIEAKKTFHFHKDDPSIINSPEMSIFKDFIAQQIVLVPVLARDDVFGLLLLWDRSPLRVFRENDIAFLELLANNIGIIVERERLLIQSEQYSQELQILHDLAQALSSSPNWQDVLKVMVSGVNEMDKNILCASVTLTSSQTEDSRYAHCFNGDQDDTCPVDDEIAKLVMATGSRQVVEDTHQSMASEDSLIKTKPRTLIGFPLRAGGNMLGVLQIAYQDPKEFSTRMIHNLEMLADRAAAAIHNRQLLEKITTQAMTDTLTGLSNRRAFEQELQKEIARTKRNKSEFCLLFIDLDGFKTINDRFGHPEGDKTLQKVAQCFLDSTRDSDFVARFGGDEFVILLPDTGVAGGEKVAATIQAKFDHCSFEWKSTKESLIFGASIGVVQYPDQASSIEALYQLGDELLYRDKDRNR